jgi:ketosteroid isomerase-like protein
MKKTFLLFGIASLLFAGCQQDKEPAGIDLKSEEAAVRAMLTSFNSVLSTQDLDSMASFIAEDALILGTDPTEGANKEATMNVWKQLAGGPKVDFKFFGENQLKMAPDGNSAVAVCQFDSPNMMPNIPLRNIYYLNKIDGKWMISFWSTGLIPKNEDLPKIIGAMMPENS